VAPLPATSPTAQFDVSWAGDDGDGSGVQSYTIFVSVDDGEFLPWLVGTPETSATFEGEHGRTYRFYSIATDNVGYTEAAPPAADAQTTTTDSPMILTGDYNGNGIVEQADLDLVLLNWGQTPPSPPPGWLFELPVGAVDQQELDAVLLNWGRSVARPVPVGDYNGNGLVEQGDLDLVLLNWGRDSSASPIDSWINALPEGVIDQQELDELLLNWGATLGSLPSTARAAEGREVARKPHTFPREGDGGLTRWHAAARDRSEAADRDGLALGDRSLERVSDIERELYFRGLGEFRIT
jgi:hypothetical protein